MIPFENPVCAGSASIVNAIVNKAPNARNLLLHKHGCGLSFLIGRYCWERAGQFHAAVADATIASVLRREIAADDELPTLVRSIFRRLLPEYEEDLAAHTAKVLDEIGRTHAKEITEIWQDLKIFRPAQMKALIRFYVNGECPSAICSDAGLSQDQFNDTRKVAWQVVRLALGDSGGLRKRASRVFRAEFKTRAVAS